MMLVDTKFRAHVYTHLTILLLSAERATAVPAFRNPSCMFAGTRGFMLHMILCELCEPKSSSYTSHVWVLTQWRSARSPNLEQTAYKFSVCNVWAANFWTTKSSERKANSWIIQSANQIHKHATYCERPRIQGVTVVIKSQNIGIRLRIFAT